MSAEGHALTGPTSDATAWPLELLAALTDRAGREPGLRELWVLGSARQSEQMDQWSDIDVGLVLNGPVTVESLLPVGSTVWALDRQTDDVRSTCRIVLDDGRRLDLVVAPSGAFARAGGRRAYSCLSSESTTAGTLMTSEPPEPAVNGVRFIAAQAVVKYGRDDRLIGSHLTLELAQLCLVEAMLLRDRDEGTTSHRFGTTRDNLAADIWAVLEQPDSIGAEKIRLLLEVFDRLHTELDDAYVPDWSALDSIIRGYHHR